MSRRGSLAEKEEQTNNTHNNNNNQNNSTSALKSFQEGQKQQLHSSNYTQACQWVINNY